MSIGRYCYKLLGTVIVSSIVIASEAQGQQHDATIDGAVWLTGCWEARSATRVAQEIWLAPFGGVMVEVGRTLRNNQFAGAELVVLRVEAGKLVYEASPTGQAKTPFTSTTVSDTLLVFENPQHDFPKKIGYRRGADSLHAWIEGNGRRIPFSYGRVSCASLQAK